MFFEGHAAFFAVVVPIAAIAGSYFAGVRGAKIQARGGQDQASAARDAAEIAAEAQRVAALWTVRQVQVAEFIQSAREVSMSADGFYKNYSVEDQQSRRDRVSAAAKTMSLTEAEIQLIAPAAVVDASFNVARAATNAYVCALMDGPTVRARSALKRIAYGDGEHEVKRAALAAIRVLDDESSSHADRQEAVSAVPGLAEEHVLRLGDRRRGAPVRRLEERRREHQEAFKDSMAALVSAAREMLKSEEDVAPTVPEQRRRWRLRNSVASTAGSA
ncbi:hypothetical protein SVTN_31250 [Streptomyces vietnamensis]|uniref:Uncharacterized protein n=1 Tax=Streptomyces vietnamensis TaxID=362257 RepID=A0A0B5ICF9_9ACTN|nr:hypothetical protein SVTN_31250 [Streptomyces vietnamensis]